MIDKNEYAGIARKYSPRSNTPLNCLKAFLIGGAICALGQGLHDLYLVLGFDEKTSSTLCSVSLIFLRILLTALHLYSRLGKHGGAGTLVQITGFANAMSAPAIEFRSEGFITGIGAKLFSVSGPVIVYGTLAAAVWGVIVYFFGL
jgi:stage V sporulation protein AC